MGEIAVKWASTSISGAGPGHSSLSGNIGPFTAILETKLLNDCKLFSYNQLSGFGRGRSDKVARRVHLGTLHHHLEMQRWRTRNESRSPAPKNCPPICLGWQPRFTPCPINLLASLVPALERVVESTKRRRRILNMVQDALSQLRLDMKYLMFDVEATRRERDEYQNRLQEFES